MTPLYTVRCAAPLLYKIVRGNIGRELTLTVYLTLYSKGMTIANRMLTLYRTYVEVQEGEDGCWLWTGARGRPDGYGRTWFDGKTVHAHRLFYSQLVGPIPEGHVIDHLCNNRSCVRLTHLEAVTPGENTKRAHANPNPSKPNRFGQYR